MWLLCLSVGRGGAMDGLCERAHTPLPRSSLPGLGPCLSTISGALPRLGGNHPLARVHAWVGEKDFVALELGTEGAFSRTHTKLLRK